MGGEREVNSKGRYVSCIINTKQFQLLFIRFENENDFFINYLVMRRIQTKIHD